MEEEMKLINGKFYEGDQIIPLEFGNVEQIKLIQQTKDKLEGLQSGGLIVCWPGEEIDINFECMCGYEMRFKAKRESHLYGKHSCHNCKKSYKIEQDKDYGFTIIKFA